MESPIGQQKQQKQSPRGKKISKQLTGRRDDTPLHSAARTGNLAVVKEIISKTSREDMKELVSKQNQSGEIAIYAAVEFGCVEIVMELIKFYEAATVAVKARNGYDPFHLAVKQGDVEILKILLEAIPDIPMTVDLSNTTALHTAATQGHIEVVDLLLEFDSSMARIARTNRKTALHSACRNGHVRVVKALLRVEPDVRAGDSNGFVARSDNKGQTALHMAVKGQSLEIVEELLKSDVSLANLTDKKGNTALHIAARKGRGDIVKRLMQLEEIDYKAINRFGETALDTAEKTGQAVIAAMMVERGIPTARALNAPAPNPARELKKTVSDIKHDVHSQLKTTRQTRKRVQGIAKKINKLHEEGLNNAINSTTVVAVLIATVAFAAIFTVPGEYTGGQNDVPTGFSPGQANIAHKTAFMLFFVFDSVALFISLAVVVVQTSVVVIESKAKKQMMAIINKLMWLACVLISVSFLALSFVVVGHEEMWLAIGVTIIGTIILATTLGTMIYLVIAHKVESKRIKRNSLSRSLSESMSTSNNPPDLLNEEYKKMYAI